MGPVEKCINWHYTWSLALSVGNGISLCVSLKGPYIQPYSKQNIRQM